MKGRRIEVKDAGALFQRGGHHVDTTPEKRRAALRRPYHNALISLGEIGAGEGIRTLDPNLGKVVLLRDSISRSLRPRQAVECAFPLRVPASFARLTFGRH